MKLEKSLFSKKHLTVAIALVLMLAMAVPYLPSAFGQTFAPGARISYAFAAASPNPAPKDSTVFMIGWVYPPPSVSGQLYGDFAFTVTKPDGTKVSRTAPSNTQASAAFGMVVDQLGNWTLHFSFKGDPRVFDRLPAESNDYVIQVVSGTFVQPDYSKMPDYSPLFPVSSANQEWFRISGEWPTGSGYSKYFNPYTTGPLTSHILWRMSVLNEGLLGGSAGHDDVVRNTGKTNIAASPVVWGNRMYISYAGAVGSPIGQYASNATFDTPTSQARHVKCLDLTTGDLLWDTVLPYMNYTTGQIVSAARTGGGTLSMVITSTLKGVGIAQDFGVIPPGGNEYGCYALWATGSGMWRLDPITGAIIWYQLQPVISPTYDPWTKLWFINNYPTTGMYSAIDATEDYNTGWPPGSLTPTYNTLGNLTYNGCMVWSKNVSQTGIAANFIGEGYIVQLQTNSATQGRKINTWDALTGNLIANGTYYAAPEPGQYASSGSNPNYGQGVYSLLCADGITRAWSFKTGNLAWESPRMDYPWGVFGTYNGFSGAGLILSGSYAPYFYAYNATTGKLAWKQGTATLPDGTQNPFNFEYAENGAVTWGCAVTATNAVYWPSGEHTPANPTQRGDALYANAIDGTLLWRLPYFKGTRAQTDAGVACQKLWFENQMDGYLYVFGQGSTQTTVSVSQSPVVEGGTTVIQGRVTDISAGTQTAQMKARFPGGVPAVADGASMDTWMAYLYTLGAEGPTVKLSTVKGVDVTLTAIGSDGSFINIGKVKADSNGFYTTMWSPPNADCIYTVLAQFSGSGAYYSSYAETSVGVVKAPAVSPIVTPTPTTTIAPTASPIVTPTVAPTPTPTTPAGPGGIPASTIYAIAAAIVVIVIVVLAAVALKRRK
jgi:outer membrane protein assembly factor BamB